jgi:hypothetical protein
MKLALFLLVLIPVAVPVRSQTSTPSLKSLRKIYVGPMGQSDEAERFRILLGNELTKVGFEVVDNESKADATLSGVLTVRVYSKESIAQATMNLTTSGGVHLWGKDFEPRVIEPRLHPQDDTVKLRAEEVAKDLRKDWKKK